jgi:hypothetical protein
MTNLNYDPADSSSQAVAKRGRLVNLLISVQEALRQFDLDEAEHQLAEAKRACSCDPDARVFDDDCQVAYWSSRVDTIKGDIYR